MAIFSLIALAALYLAPVSPSHASAGAVRVPASELQEPQTDKRDPSPAVQKKPSEDSESGDAPLAEAKSLLQKGMVNEAGRAVRQYLEKHANSAQGHFLLGYILFREIQVNAGIKGSTEGVKDLIPGGSDPDFRAAKAKESLAEFTEGAKYHDPGAFDLKIVALDYVLLGDTASADKWLSRSLQWNPDDSEGWYYLGRTKYNENRFAEAIHAFEECLKRDPRNVKAEDNLGLSYAGLGRNEEAISAYQTAIAWQTQSAGRNAGPYLNLGSLLIDENRLEEAVSNLIQAVDISPFDSKAHELLGKAYSHLNHLQKAHSEMERAVELDPRSGPLHCMLAQIYKKEGLLEKAKPEFDQCAELHGPRSLPGTPRR